MSHVCRFPPDQPVGTLYVCPDCWSEFARLRIIPPELTTPLLLWVRLYEPGNWSYVPPQRRHRGRSKTGAKP